jgi:hypothetical protein
MTGQLREKLMTLLIATALAGTLSFALPASAFAQRGNRGNSVPADPPGSKPPGKCRVINGGTDIPGKQCGW